LEYHFLIDAPADATIVPGSILRFTMH
jgi:hypothetical protein